MGRIRKKFSFYPLNDSNLPKILTRIFWLGYSRRVEHALREDGRILLVVKSYEACSCTEKCVKKIVNKF